MTQGKLTQKEIDYLFLKNKLEKKYFPIRIEMKKQGYSTSIIDSIIDFELEQELTIEARSARSYVSDAPGAPKGAPGFNSDAKGES